MGTAQRICLGAGGRRRLGRRSALRGGDAVHQECRRPSGLLARALARFRFWRRRARTMMLVYDLPATDAIYQRFVGIEGSAYFVGGLGMTALSFNNIIVVPVRSGVGLRLGANVGYLKFTPTSTWNPF